MHVLITGGLGFIGSTLVPRLLALSHSVTVLDQLTPQIHGAIPSFRPTWVDDPRVRIIRADILSNKVLPQAFDGVTAVAHLAAETGTGQSMYEVARYNEVNSQGTAALLDYVINSKPDLEKFVVTSSRSVYGEGSYICDSCDTAARQTPEPRREADLKAGRWEPLCQNCHSTMRPVGTAETAPSRPASVYAATKAAQEDLVRIVCTSARIPAVALRLQNVYGAGQSLKNPYTGIISIFTNLIRNGLEIPIYEDGLESRDFVHVDDVASGLISALLYPKSSEYSVFNIGSGHGTTVLELARLLSDANDAPVRTNVTGEFRLGDVRHCFADMTAARRDLQFSPSVDLPDGLKRFVEWAETQPVEIPKLAHAAADLRNRGLMSRASS